MNPLIPFLLIFGIICSLEVSPIVSQTEKKVSFFHRSDTLNKNRAYTLIGGTAVGYTATMIGLNAAWYKGYEREKFHFFNDMGEWNDMDKVGHFYSAYNESLIWMYGGIWAGIPRRKAMWWGVGFGTLFQSSIEVLDGFSSKWGFSVGDIAFNTAGFSLLAGQELLWKEQRITLKFSAHPVSYPELFIMDRDGVAVSSIQRRADDLYGATFYEQFLKDYNGQTYWASFNIHSFMKKENTLFPKWLNIALGYGVENLLGGFENKWEEGAYRFDATEAFGERRRQFYLSLDIDFTRIKTKSPFVNGLLMCLNILKCPAPALRWNNKGGGFGFHPLYF